MGKSIKHILVFSATILAMLLLSCSQKREKSASFPSSSQIALNAPISADIQSNPAKSLKDSTLFDNFDDESTDLDEAEGRAFMIRGHETLDSLSN